LGEKNLNQNKKDLLLQCHAITGVDWFSEPSEYLFLLAYVFEEIDRFAKSKWIPCEFRYCKRGGDKKKAKRLRAKILESMKND